MLFHGRVLLLLCVVLELGASVYNDSRVFRKCCLQSESLVRIVTDGTAVHACVDRSEAEQKYNITSFSHLIIAENVTVAYGIPDECDNLLLSQITDTELNIVSNACYDRLVLDVADGSVKDNLDRTVILHCVQNKTSHILESGIQNIRKCCPENKVYDMEYHVCRDSDEAIDASELISRLSTDTGYVYEADVGLHCKASEYSVELREDRFNLSLKGSYLNIVLKNGADFLEETGSWCVDRTFDSDVIVARVCTENCVQYEAYCYRKCCPIGENYLPIHCGTTKSRCVPSDGVIFNVSKYLDPVRAQIADVHGIRTELQCSRGRVVVDDSLPGEQHSLNIQGWFGFWNDYCLEMFDFRSCPQREVVVAPVVCFVPKEDVKNFKMNSVMAMVSAVFLALTLLVYCALPELHNLHGKVIICHIATMLSAFCFLARAQFKHAEESLCTVIGYGIYSGFVGAFLWLNVMCFDIWSTFGSIRSVQPLRKKSAERKRFLWYSLYAWGGTVAMTSLVYMLDVYDGPAFLDANMGQISCWFGAVQNSSTDWPHYLFFVIPLGLVTSVNLALWVLTARHCAQVRSEVHRLQAGSFGDRAKKRFRADRAKYVITVKLWAVMGAGWITELLSTLFRDPYWLWQVIDFVNQLQGVFIFLIFVMKPKIYHLIRKRLGLEKPEVRKNGTSSSSARTSSTFISRTISTEERTTLRASHVDDSKKT